MSKACRRTLTLLAAVAVAIMAACSSSSPPITVSLSPSSAQGMDVGQTLALKATVANDSSNAGVSWNLTGPGSLNGTTGFSVSYVAPTTNLTSPEQATVTATSVKDKTKTATVQITVNPYPAISALQTLATGTVGSPYNQTIQLTGGSAPFQWSVYDGPVETGWEVGGSVPDGLTLNASTGTISGTPTGGGTWYFEAQVTDAAGVTVANPFLNIQIDPSALPGNPIPFLNQALVPTAVAPGSPAFLLTVSGTGFVPPATIVFNNSGISTTFVDSEHLAAMIPAASVATALTAPVTVVNGSPGGGQSNTVYFQVAAPESTVSFANAANSPISVYLPTAVAVADFNEDGKPDLAIAGNVRMYIMLGNGDGTFTPASGSPVPIPSPPYDDLGSPYVGPALAVGDFNHSGHQGLAVGLFQNEAVAILFGKGNGTFNYSTTLTQTFGQPTSSLTAADFNADGYLDLIATNTLNGVSPVPLLGYGHGAFNQVGLNIQLSGVSSAAGDFNSDGKLDVVIDGTNVLLGNGDGTFTQGAFPDASGTFVTVADFNGDGKLDLAVCNQSQNSVSVYLGDGAGNFTIASQSPISVGNQPDAIVAGDFNNDGKLDLAVANFADNTVTLLLGNGDGTFTASSGSPYPVGNGPYAIAAADFNGDGKLDLAIANLTDGTVSILLQQ